MKKKTIGFTLVLISTVLAVIGLVLYRNTLVKTDMVNIFLILAIAAGVCAIVAAIAMGRELANFIAAAHVILMMVAIAVSISPMVNDIALAYAGLNQWNSILPYFYFAGVVCAGWLLGLVASFTGIVKNQPEIA